MVTSPNKWKILEWDPKQTPRISWAQPYVTLIKLINIDINWFVKCSLHYHRSDYFSCGCNSLCVIYWSNSGVLFYFYYWSLLIYVFSFCPYKRKISMLRFIALRWIRFLRTWRIYNAHSLNRDEIRVVDSFPYITLYLHCDLHWSIALSSLFNRNGKKRHY